MIQKVYTCDLCEERLIPNGNPDGFRLKFVSRTSSGAHRFELVRLVSSDSASEKIVCEHCLRNLKEVVAR